MIQPLLNRVVLGEEATPLEPKVMEVLVCLASRPGAVWTRDELLAAVWPGTVVTEEALTRCVSILRRTFADDPQEPTFIETIRKSGYRLIAPVAPVGREPEAVPPARGAGAAFYAQRLRGWPAVLGGVLLIGMLGLAWFGVLDGPDRPPLAIVPFTSYVGNEMQPAFSPDGHHIAFAWDDRQGTRIDIFVKSIEAATPLRLSADSAYEVSPTWSPDGTSIAYARVGGDCAIFVVPMLGGAARRLAPCDGWGNPQLAWSPDGKTMAVAEHESRDAPRRIHLLSIESLEKKLLTDPLPQYRGDQYPAFSPDGKTLAFARTTDQVSELYTVPTSGGAAHRLTFDNRRIGGLSWSADGKYIVYSSDRGGTFSLWRVPAAGGAPELVLASSEPLYNPTISPGAGRMAYEHWSGEVNIYRFSLDGEAPEATPVVSSTREDTEPRMAPGGERLAFVSNRSGFFEIWLADPDGAAPVQLTAFEGPVTGSPSWSPDGRYLAFDSRGAGHTDVYVVDAAGGLPRRLTTAPSIDTVPNGSRDGAWVYFASDRGGGWDVWKVPAAGGEAVRVTQGGAFRASESPDGAYLYFTRRGAEGLWRQRVEGGEAVQVTALQPYADNWTTAADGLYFVFMDALLGPHLARFDYESGEIEVLVPLPSHPRSASLTAAPDGRSFVYAHLDRSESDLMLADHVR